MGNVGKIIKGDIQRISRSVITMIIIVGLVLLPSMFSWLNVLACWDVFGNMGNLQVAVANTDAGYESDILPNNINVGDKIVDALRDDTRFGWVITSEEDAIDGARAGRYYAAIVIPESFSQDMMTFYSENATRAPIIYYSNSKKNAISSKLLDQGANQVSYQINEVFTKTLTSTALEMVQNLMYYSNSEDLGNATTKLNNRLQSFTESLKQTSATLSAYASLLDSVKRLVSDSTVLVTQAKDEMNAVQNSVQGTGESASALANALLVTTDALNSALNESLSNYDEVMRCIDEAFAQAGTSTASSVSMLRQQADNLGNEITAYQEIVAQLKVIEQKVPEEAKPLIKAYIDMLETSLAREEQLQTSLYQAADDLESGNGEVQQKYEELRAKIVNAKAGLDTIQLNYTNELRPKLAELSEEINTLVEKLNGGGATLNGMADDLTGSSDSVLAGIDKAKTKIDDTTHKINEAVAKLEAYSAKVNEALNNGSLEGIKEAISSDASALASVFSSVVVMERHTEYPVNTLGSAMAPLYTTLALWVGAMLAMVTIKMNVSEDFKRKQLSNPREWQCFLGRFGIFALISFLQSTIMGLGFLFFLEVQVLHPWLYMLCLWVSGLAITFIIYTLVASFGNVGKALGVLLLILAVSSGGGGFPLQLMPQFIQDISPFMVPTHVIDAMREAMFGLYRNDYWIHLFVVVLFTLPFMLLGLVLRNPLIKVNDMFVEMIEKSKLM